MFSWLQVRVTCFWEGFCETCMDSRTIMPHVQMVTDGLMVTDDLNAEHAHLLCDELG